MRVLHVVPNYYPAVRYGGPIVSVRRLCEELAQQGLEVDVATTNGDGPGDLDVPTDRWKELGGVRVRYFRRWPRVGYATSRALAMFLKAETAGYDLIHVAGAFSFPALAAGLAAGAAHRPYIVSPRGTIQPWALSHKRWKKWPYWALFERRNLARASAIHATAEPEAKALLSLFPSQDVFVVPNGVDTAAPPVVERNPRRVVFLGRIHRVKGFDVLLPALARVSAVMPDVETIVAGPDEEGEWHRIERSLESAARPMRIRYVGAVAGDEKWKLLASAAVFVLSSHSENFGVSVVEALASGTPVVVSRNCPWRQAEERGAGYWVENTPEQVASALLRVLSDPALARRMGQAGVELAQEYSWHEMAHRMADQYRRIVGTSTMGDRAGGRTL